MRNKLKDGEIFRINSDIKMRLVKKDKNSWVITYLLISGEEKDDRIYTEEALLHIINIREFEFQLLETKTELFKKEIKKIVRKK